MGMGGIGEPSAGWRGLVGASPRLYPPPRICLVYTKRNQKARVRNFGRVGGEAIAAGVATGA